MSLETIAAELALKHQLSSQQVYSLLSGAFRLIELEAFETGRCVVRGLGVFRLQTFAPRMGRNPRTGELVPVNERRRMVFRQAADRQRALQLKARKLSPEAVDKDSMYTRGPAPTLSLLGTMKKEAEKPDGS